MKPCATGHSCSNGSMTQGAGLSLKKLSAVPSEWSLEKVLDAWVHVACLCFYDFHGEAYQEAFKVVVGRLVELWALLPEQAAQWFARQQKLHEQLEFLGPRKARLAEALLRHAQVLLAEGIAYDFTSEGLVREVSGGSIYVHIYIYACIFDTHACIHI